MAKLQKKRGFKAVILTLLCLIGISSVFMTTPTRPAHALAICPCDDNKDCFVFDCVVSRVIIAEVIHNNVLEKWVFPPEVERRFNSLRKWFVRDFFGKDGDKSFWEGLFGVSVDTSDKYILRDFRYLAQQMSAVSMQQAMIVGTFLDARQQLETQRLFGQLRNQAHQDYQPSEDFCWFGTNVRSMAATEARAKYQSQALNVAQMARQMGTSGSASASTSAADKQARWEQFTRLYCDKGDSGWALSQNNEATGLQAVCKNVPAGTRRPNKDISYTALIDNPLTLDFRAPKTQDRTDVLAMSNNLYAHDVITRSMNDENLKSEIFQELYLALRSLTAKRNVAQNSFNAIVELKASGTSNLPEGEEAGNELPDTRAFLAAIVKEMGVPEEEIFDYIGQSPSYYAQLELLAKKIYQNPDFYTNLYDKPANVSRKSVALKAIELMLDRAIYESELRQEMVYSVLLSTNLKDNFDAMADTLSSRGAR